jgi:hypothetical protein
MSIPIKHGLRCVAEPLPLQESAPRPLNQHSTPDACAASNRREPYGLGRIACVSILLLCVSILAVQAHKSSDAYLKLRVEGDVIEAQWDVALRDLESAIGLDADDDGAITWGELKSRKDLVVSHLLSRLRFSSNEKTARFEPTDLLVDRHSDGAYAVVRFRVEGLPAHRRFQIDYAAFFDIDPQHRGLLRIDQGAHAQTAVFSPEQSRCYVEATSDDAPAFFPFVREGIWHILMGLDHLLFLAALLLPAVLQRTASGWQRVERFREALANLVKVVTAFTLAHSLTLTLATLDVVRLPTRWVESAIAASVLLAAMNNLRPFIKGRAWVMAFTFGLIHGFGFANVLADLSLPPTLLASALFGFNVGVEAGQLAVVGLFFPFIFLMRGSLYYQPITLRFGSSAIGLLATVWMAERLFDLKLLPQW